MEQETGKVHIFVKILLAFVVAFIGHMYFSQTEWVVEGGIREGYLSSDTYLNGGTSPNKVTKNCRYAYEYIIYSGEVIIEVKNEEGAVVKKQVVTETSAGFIDLNDLEPGTYYAFQFAENPSTKAHTILKFQKQRTYFDAFIDKIFPY